MRSTGILRAKKPSFCRAQSKAHLASRCSILHRDFHNFLGRHVVRHTVSRIKEVSNRLGSYWMEFCRVDNDNARIASLKRVYMYILLRHLHVVSHTHNRNDGMSELLTAEYWYKNSLNKRWSDLETNAHSLSKPSLKFAKKFPEFLLYLQSKGSSGITVLHFHNFLERPVRRDTVSRISPVRLRLHICTPSFRCLSK